MAATIAERLEACGIYREHSGATLADFPTVRITPHREWRGVFITGAVGRGKTRLAVALARWGYLAGWSFEFLTAWQLLRRIWDTFRDDSTTSESVVVDRLCALDLLVIDDLGPGREGRVTPAVIAAVHQILSRRGGNLRPTVVTSNLMPSQIGDVYDVSIASRLAAFDQVKLTGLDRRL